MIRAKQLGKAGIFIAVGVLAVFLLSTVTLNRVQNLKDSFRIAFSSGGDYPISIDDAVPVGVNVMDGAYAVLTNHTLYTFTNSGRPFISYEHSLAGASMKASANRVLLYNRGSKEFDFFSRTEHLNSGYLDSTIIDADVTDFGKPIILKESERYTGELTLFSNDGGAEEFTWYCSDGFPYGVFASDSGNTAVVAAAKLDSDGLSTLLYYINLSGKRQDKVVQVDAMVIDCYLDGSSTVLVTEDDYRILNSSGNVSYSYSFDSIPLIHYISGEGGLDAIALGDNNKKGINQIVVFSDSRHEYAYTVSGLDRIDCMYSKGGTLYVLTNGIVTEYNSKGELMSQTDVSDDTDLIITVGSIIAVMPNYIIKY